MRATYNGTHGDRSPPAPPDARPIREVRRYPNRRLYDTRERCYVALERLAALVDEGEQLRVIDAKSDEDVTLSVLAPLLVERLCATLAARSDGVAELHAWLRGERSIVPATIAVDEPQDTVAPVAAPLSPEERIAQLERRVAALESARNP
jgi:hypothetical protein